MNKKTTADGVPKLRVAVVDDHLLIRKSMILLVNSFEGMEVVLDAGNGQAFLMQMTPSCQVDVVLLDIQMPVMNGYETCRHLLKFHPGIKILMVSQLTLEQSIHKVMDIGAHGYFSKNTAPEQLQTAIRWIYSNGYYFESSLGNVLREALSWERKRNLDKMIPDNRLTERELQVITLMCREMSSHEIAGQLFISVRSVEAHRRSIMDKTYSQNVIGVVLYALKRNLVSLEEL